uniref:Uncharacterized protein n=1 Tax=Anguilla anguilla TaxID=7936 RepID=A0A0E9X4V1_ANGAN
MTFWHVRCKTKSALCTSGAAHSVCVCVSERVCVTTPSVTAFDACLDSALQEVVCTR